MTTSTCSRFLLAAVLILAVCSGSQYSAVAQGTAYDGYTLFNPNNSRTTYLVDMQGNTVHQWNHARNGGYSVYLLENGHLLRPAVTSTPAIRGAASAGLIQEIDWDGNVVWEFDYAGSDHVTHHDIEPMPNGNILMIAWEVKSSTEAAAAGRVNARTMWPDHLVEVKPEGTNGGTIVWEWHAWDHLVQDRDPSAANYGIVSEHPELIDINLGGVSGGPGSGDWLHINGISYNPVNDQIVISSHFMDEIYVIDHSTTKEEAAGHAGGQYGKGGDLLYRWGKPQNYGAPGGEVFDVVHCSYWVPEGLPGEGNIMAFNNNERTRASTIVEISPPVDGEGRYILQSGQAYGPTAPHWSYSNGSVFYSNHLGGNQRLPNGNTLITEATSGYLFEVDPQGNEVWNFSFGQQIARSLRHGRDYPGLAALLGTDVGTNPALASTITISCAPNPLTDFTVFNYSTHSANDLRITIHDMLGKQLRVLHLGDHAPGNYQATWDGRDYAGNRVAPGMYVYSLISTTENRVSGKVLVTSR